MKIVEDALTTRILTTDQLTVRIIRDTADQITEEIIPSATTTVIADLVMATQTNAHGGTELKMKFQAG